MRHSKIFIGLLMLSIIAYGQKTEVTLAKYTQKDGLSSYNIRKIIQDKFGFIWAATQDGLSKFDGRSFTNYTKNSTAKNKISGTDVRELIEDTAGNLIWVLPGEVGINAISTITGEVKISVHIPYTSNDDWNISMLKDKNCLWIGTSTGVWIYNTDSKKFETISHPQNEKSFIDLAVRTILKDENGNIWVCYDRFGIVIYSGTSKKVIATIKLAQLNDHLKSNEVRIVRYLLLKNEILLATNQGLRKISYNKNYDIVINNEPCKGYKLLNTENIEFIETDGQKNILIAGFEKLFKFDNALSIFSLLEEHSRINETDWLNAVRCIYKDAADNIWLGCQEGLAFLNAKDNSFKPFNYDKKTNIKLEHARSVCPLANGNILVGLTNGIVEINHVSNSYVKYDSGHLCNHIFQDKKGIIYVSRNDGLSTFDNGKLSPVAKSFPEFTFYSSIPINSHLFINDSLIILGSENNNGILLWNPLKKKVRQIKQGNGDVLSSNIVNNIFKDSKQNIWVLSDNIITILTKDFEKKKEISLLDKTEYLSYKLYFDVCEAKGYFWVASYGSGILQLDSSYNLVKVLNGNDKLSNDGVYQVYNLSDKSLLVTSNNGLSVINLNTFNTRFFFLNDGLHSNGFEEVCGFQKDSLIYAGGINGFTIINPSKFYDNTAPPAFYFTGTKIEFGDKQKEIDTTDFNMHSIDIPENWLQVNIAYIGQNYLNPNRVTYFYRLIEKDTSWINNGNQNSITIIGLSPSTYTLEVKAKNEDGYWSQPKQLILIFQPKWYQTIWFSLLVTITLMGLLYAVYKYRISQIKAQHLIRKNISSDLHDDIGSTLNTVKVFTHLAKRDVKKKEYLDQIEESLTEATIGLRDMIWVLDDAMDTVAELIERIKKFAIPIASASNIRFECKQEMDPRDQKLSKNEKRNLLLMMKEIINNSIKYSDCTVIKITFSSYNNKKMIEVSDNGIGFDSTVISEGNGLKNLYRRAEQIQYQIKIISSSENGTLIKIQKR